jgi:hypothetical protein
LRWEVGVVLTSPVDVFAVFRKGGKASLLQLRAEEQKYVQVGAAIAVAKTKGQGEFLISEL